MFTRVSALSLLALLGAGLAGCGGGGNGSADVAAQNSAMPESSLSPAAQIGRQLFSDKSLSYSGQVSCASCHDPANHYAQSSSPAAQSAPLSPGSDQRAVRIAPSLTYVQAAPATQAVAASASPALGGGEGGLGIALAQPVSLHAPISLLSPVEMANPGPINVVTDIVENPLYVSEFQQTFGADVFSDVNNVFQSALYSLAQYQVEDASFHRYDSKYDYYLAGVVELTPEESRGMSVFMDPRKANCGGCHSIAQSAASSDSASANQSTAANSGQLGFERSPPTLGGAAASYFDMGVCGALGVVLSPAANPTNALYCPGTNAPTLRNAANRISTLQNGSVTTTTLTEAATFHLTRGDSSGPGNRISSGASVQSVPYSILPSAYQGGLDVAVVGSQSAAHEPTAFGKLSGDELSDLAAFLATLTDGYSP